MMTEGFMGFFAGVFILLIIGFGILLLYASIYIILFGKKRLQEQLKEENQKLLAMEKRKETLTSQKTK